MSQDDSRELTRKSTRGILILHLAGSLRLGDEPLCACVDQCQDSVTLEGQANPKESRERCAELWESARGTRQVEGYQRTAAK